MAGQRLTNQVSHDGGGGGGDGGSQDVQRHRKTKWHVCAASYKKKRHVSASAPLLADATAHYAYQRFN